ncbi:hypothetical protein [Pedobacter sp. BMA]|uniref:hypothetical protein n=1 Tax=Pedobacter sp. BMA TaxID=1663685 RepID=UPI0018CCDD60|nr:hypothetical protein [Pedobacter sp. BMA]
MNESKKHDEDADKETAGKENNEEQRNDKYLSDQNLENNPNKPDDEADFENPDDDPA